MIPVAPQPIDLDLLARVHRQSYITTLKDFAERGGGHIDADTYVAPRSYEAALLAAGGAVELVRAVLARPGAQRYCIGAAARPSCHARPRHGLLSVQ